MIFLKKILYTLEEVNIPNFEGDQNNFNKYFIETNNDEDHEIDILHFIMVNAKDKNSQKVRFFNEPTTQFIRDLIDISIYKRSNFLDCLVKHIKFISTRVLKREWNEIKIVLDKNNNEKIIFTGEKINIKSITEDKFDNIVFTGEYYEPPFRYYKNKGKFVIEIQLCCEYYNLKIQQLKENEEFLFIITGEKKIVDDEEAYVIEIDDLIDNFRVEFKIRKKDFEIDALEKIDKNDDKSVFMEYGILYFNFNIE